MTTATRTDIWALAAEAKRAELDTEAALRGDRATAILNVQRLLSEFCGLRMDTDECHVLSAGNPDNRWNHHELVVSWAGAQWFARDDTFRQLWCHKADWPKWRVIRRLADLA